ncbi:hypothetical protein G7085_16055 [Tessaracoccus sp. HDW20]|uniref:hypothetical protein n=1 Tax=Tessaracoccus coleopterorum TaxID=2714950 RepID=UPI0018D4ACC2|nr:hypothetical protein [Tessaracoccus coleopterorum]NHB85599.1 hypothetical protein [Tessaracoccus coleopterorum]
MGLATLGFATVLLVSRYIAAPAIQPILALILAAAGTIGLLLSRGRTNKKKNRKELS